MYKRLRRCIRSLRYAKDEIKIIRDEAVMVAQLLHMFYDTVTNPDLADEGLSAKIKTSNIGKLITESGKGILRKIDDLLHKVEPLRADKAYSQIQKLIARLRWLSRKEEWTPIQVSLNSIKLNAQLLMSMLSFQHRFQKLRKLKMENMAISKEHLKQMSALAFQDLLLHCLC